LAVPSNILEHPGETLAAASFAPNLRRLEIASTHDDPNVWHPLWRSDRFVHLKRFGFRTRLDLPSQLNLADLMAAPWFSGLDRLELAGKGYNDRALVVHDLANLLRRGQVRALELERCRFPEESAAGLQGLPAVALEHLVLGNGCEVGNRVLRALLLSPGLAGLRSFTLTGNARAALTYLLDSPLRESLRILRLPWCDPARLLRLARVGCPRLAHLSIAVAAQPGESNLMSAVIDAILDPRAFPRLVSLTIAEATGAPNAEQPGGSSLIRLIARHREAVRLKEFGVQTPLTPEDLPFSWSHLTWGDCPAWRFAGTTSRAFRTGGTSTPSSSNSSVRA
jgi:hypothetical protein